LKDFARERKARLKKPLMYTVQLKSHFALLYTHRQRRQRDLYNTSEYYIISLNISFNQLRNDFFTLYPVLGKARDSSVAAETLVQL
jgi:hypothetical protein